MLNGGTTLALGNSKLPELVKSLSINAKFTSCKSKKVTSGIGLPTSQIYSAGISQEMCAKHRISRGSFLMFTHCTSIKNMTSTMSALGGFSATARTAETLTNWICDSNYQTGNLWNPWDWIPKAFIIIIIFSLGKIHLVTLLCTFSNILRLHLDAKKNDSRPRSKLVRWYFYVSSIWLTSLAACLKFVVLKRTTDQVTARSTAVIFH